MFLLQDVGKQQKIYVKSNETGVRLFGRGYDSLIRNKNVRILATQVLWWNNFVSLLDVRNSRCIGTRYRVRSACGLCRT